MTIDGLEHSASGDAVLLAAVRSGDPSSFAELYDRHAAAALTVARQYTNSRQDAEDVVADAFTAVYAALQRGNGPDEAFRAYLYTVVRRVAAVRREQGRRTEPTDDVATLEAGSIPLAGADDPALAGFERGIVARAFRSLPERWQLVLWHTEVEGLTPAQIAPLLGLSANSTAALAYRAREGLRQAYLAEHLLQPLAPDCREVAGKLGAYVRGGLGQRESRQVSEHVDGCLECKALLVELGDVNHGMRAIVAPLVLGVVGLGALAKGLAIGGGLAALPLSGAVAGAAAGGSAAGGGAAGGSAAGGSAAGGAAAGGSAAAGAAAGGASVAGGFAAALAAVPPALAAAVVGGLVVAAAVVVVAVQLLGGGQAPVSAPTPSSTTSQEQVVPPTSAPTVSPQPTITPAAIAPTVVPAPAHLVVDLPAGGLVLDAGVADQALSVGVRNTGGTDSTALTAQVTLPAGVTISDLAGGNLQATGGLAVPAPSWVCVGASGDVAAQCTLSRLPAQSATTIVIHVSVDESYDSTDGSVGLSIEGAGVNVRMPSIKVQVAAAPARVALRGAPLPAQLVAGRTRAMSLQVANEGGIATSPAAPAVVRLALPAGVRNTTAAAGPWTCQTGAGTVECTALLGARTLSTLDLQLATDAGTAAASGSIGVVFGPTARLALAAVPYTVTEPAHLAVTVPATLDPLALGTTGDVPIQVQNTGGLTSAPLTLSLHRPVGSQWSDGSLGDGWTCTTVDADLTCTHAALAPGGQAPARLHLTAVPGVFGSLGDLVVTSAAADADADAPQTRALTALAPVLRVDTAGGHLMLTDHEAGTLSFAIVVADGADASGVHATIALPAGISYDPDAGAQTPGCAVGATSRQVLCSLDVLTAGSRTQVLVHVRASRATTSATAITVGADGGISATGSVGVVASNGGLTPRVAFAGDVHVTQVGAPLLSCGTSASCAKIVGQGTSDNNGLTMTPLDENPPVGVSRPAVRAGSSSTTLTIPAGRPVLWAGLYWSADSTPSDTWNTSLTTARLQGPGGSFQPVEGTVVADVKDSSNREYYQTFADVTDQVQALGAGTWSLADMAVSTATVTGPNANYYAGWSLVVVYGTVAPVDSATTSVTVYDGGAWSGTSSSAPVFEFTAEQDTDATIGVVAWEGDRNTPGDTFRLNGAALTPVEWDGRKGSSGNAFDSTATGWRALNSLGVDAKAFAPVPMPSDVAALTATTTGDQYLVGVVTLEAAPPNGS